MRPRLLSASTCLPEEALSSIGWQFYCRLEAAGVIFVAENGEGRD